MSKIDLVTSGLGRQLLQRMESAATICILTSFVMKSGVDFLKEGLKKAADRGADIKVCTGDYLYVTQPDALQELLKIDNRIQIRLWRSNGVSFHPKAYLFSGENEECLFIGSSNLSRSALNTGVEWNIAVSDEKELFNKALSEFLKLFLADQTIELNSETLKAYRTVYDQVHESNPNLAKEWTEAEEIEMMLPAEEEIPAQVDLVHDEQAEYGKIIPRFAQIDALEELNKTLEEEYSKALVVMATGLGKTYLAGFFAQNFNNVLFIAHREEILYQAKASFQRIMPDRNFGIYNGRIKEGEADVIFASIYTLSINTHIERFSPDEFDLIVIDEFHHAAANTYQRVLEYFSPKFLLGITATPDRNDNKDVYAICDGNVAFRLDFLKAIENRWLSPFKYYGVYDDTDYSQISWLGTRYDEEQLLQVQLREGMAENILNAWKEKKQTRTIGFCSSVRQADFLSNYFNSKGFNTVSLHSRQKGVVRGNAIAMLEKGKLDVIFTVDLFNEGVDIPPVDTLLFVRPTESLTVFTQQIGRGLRLYPGKEYCIIIDLIGNYRNADIKLSLFDSANNRSRNGQIVEPTVPQTCELNLDIKVIDLLKEMARKRQPRRDKLYEDYMQLKQEIGQRPTYLELHLKGGSDSVHYRQEFKSYIGFLEWADELSTYEQEVYMRYHDWLEEAEKTSMAKSYKMVVLLAMLNRGINDWSAPITPREAAPFFHQYLTETEYRKRIDFSDKSSKKLWEYAEEGVGQLIARMPMTKWSGSSNGLVTFNNGIFKLNLEIHPENRETLCGWTREICEYRLHYHFERKAKTHS
ncbi:DEAD/DEAH box helicase family protein [Mesobacillus zeae]|uniref:DNA helicase n=1 Tax=Mesobacillus zeae TaxID=1917180 RepID=A0A398AWH4_9BACI|nr:DEAD/DEAH box helicase family protein [Mesobacillus zeae]RID81945.1 DNA helicase [Mesobacillus zeae]